MLMKLIARRNLSFAFLPILVFYILIPSYFATTINCQRSTINHRIGRTTVNRGFSLIANPFRFSSYYYDFESKLCYLKARYYSPKLARFTSRDTYDLSNRYAYCGGNPVSNIDPNGHNAIRSALLAATAAMAVMATIATGVSIWAALSSGVAGDIWAGLMINVAGLAITVTNFFKNENEVFGLKLMQGNSGNESSDKSSYIMSSAGILLFVASLVLTLRTCAICKCVKETEINFENPVPPEGGIRDLDEEISAMLGGVSTEPVVLPSSTPQPQGVRVICDKNERAYYRLMLPGRAIEFQDT